MKDSTPRFSGRNIPTPRIHRARRHAIMEPLEGRALMSASALSGVTDTAGVAGADVIPAAPVVVLQTPSVAKASIANGATNIMRDTFISCEVNIPNGGIDPATLTHQSVYLYRQGSNETVGAIVNTSGGGDVIVLHPLSVLDPNARYTFVVTSAVKDVAGAAFAQFTSSFTTGASTSSTDSSIQFNKIALPNTDGRKYLSLVIGPDNMLYAGTDDGNILRFSINSDGTLGDPQIISSLITANGGPRFVEGLAFDPASTADHLVLWVTNAAAATDAAPDWTGKVTRLSGPNLETVEDEVIHLPRSARDHVTDQLSFGPDGAIYFCQPANTAMGAPDSGWEDRPERLLSAAILRLDPSKLGQTPVDALTPDGGGTYNPYAADAPLTIYATGVRNAYDLVWDSNGQLYAPTNGSAAGGSTPAGPGVPALADLPDPETDYLFQIQKDAYYGHPNPIRNQYVLNGGNPTAGVDPYEVSQYPVGTQPDPKWQPAIFDFGMHQSPDGALEYRGTAFGGRLDHALLVARYSGGDDVVALTVGANGGITSQLTGINGLTNLVNPLDIVEHLSNGDLYASEYGGSRISLLCPVGGGGIQVSGGIDSSNGSGSTPTPTPTPTPPHRTPHDRALIRKIATFGSKHALAAPDTTLLSRANLKLALVNLKTQASESALAARIAALGQKKSYPLPDTSGYSVAQFKSLLHLIKRAKAPRSHTTSHHS